MWGTADGPRPHPTALAAVSEGDRNRLWPAHVPIEGAPGRRAACRRAADADTALWTKGRLAVVSCVVGIGVWKSGGVAASCPLASPPGPWPRLDGSLFTAPALPSASTACTPDALLTDARARSFLDFCFSSNSPDHPPRWPNLSTLHHVRPLHSCKTPTHESL